MLKRIVVFASGTGSNFRNIKECVDKKQINGKINYVCLTIFGFVYPKLMGSIYF